jgi:hypothetical protein
MYPKSQKPEGAKSGLLGRCGTEIMAFLVKKLAEGFEGWT